MPEHVQKELLKLHGIKFHGNKIIIEEVTSTRIKRPDEENTPAKYNRSKYNRRSTTEPSTIVEVQQKLQMTLIQMLVL